MDIVVCSVKAFIGALNKMLGFKENPAVKTPTKTTTVSTWGAMGSYHICMMGENGQIPPFSKICSKKTLFRNLSGKYHKLEFLEVLPPWHCWGGNWAIKKNNMVLELRILEYHATQYSSIPSSSTFYKKEKKLHSTRVLCKFFFCLGIINK